MTLTRNIELPEDDLNDDQNMLDDDRNMLEHF